MPKVCSPVPRQQCPDQSTVGQLHTPQLVPSSFTFEETLLNVSDFNVSDEEKSMFIDFVQKMIRWDPKERATARQLLEDPWLYSDFDAR